MKQAIVIRADLKMDKGKIASQAAHASLTSAIAVMKKDRAMFDEWFNFSQAKIVLKVDSEAELIALKKQAGILKISCELIKDAGRTQVEPGTVTALGIGPDEDELIDRVVSKLKLL